MNLVSVVTMLGTNMPGVPGPVGRVIGVRGGVDATVLMPHVFLVVRGVFFMHGLLFVFRMMRSRHWSFVLHITAFAPCGFPAGGFRIDGWLLAARVVVF